ncbi:hypothetical protein NIES2135_25150 [Leptolyngbya boryana NIES-2135]|uniref:Uncharacterized protein n=2 Tax=Leptolyngbya group TaxID=3081713 RepID=A0A1Z4JG29_LEPBY|nr:hypothetical protein [Leptolyngbya sp. FACHB-402]BAY55691.1 hypothetical protein NIES2135_25150 [Leptolyngbya boryana NIES-2135]
MSLDAGKLLVRTTMAVSLIAINTHVFSFNAQANDSEDSCAGMIEAVASRMSYGRNLTIDYSRRDVTRMYDDAPSGRPIEQVLLMQGSSTDAILNSPAFMQTRARTIMESCKNVGAVTFALKGSSYGITFGLMPNETVKKFSCTESTPVAWGQVLCGGW